MIATSEPITSKWLELRGYRRRNDAAAGYERDFGEGHILNVVPHEDEWIVELWCTTPAGRSGAPFRQTFNRISEIIFLETFMEDVPF